MCASNFQSKQNEISVGSPIWSIAHERSIAIGLNDPPTIMAIVNVTPDSFSDGGLHDTTAKAVDFALQCLADGATILDIGGESTRPGAKRIEPNEQIDRVLPVIEGILQGKTAAIISVDTTRSEVAAAGLQAGAHIVNDVSAGLEDEAMFEVVQANHAGLVLMHRLHRPNEDVLSNQYGVSSSAPKRPEYPGGVVGFVGRFLKDRAECAIEAGISWNQVAIDPGLGFGKTVDQNFELIRSYSRIQRAACSLPVLSACSRKSFIGAISRVDTPADRQAGTVAVSLAHWADGVRLFRVHDVAMHHQAFAIAARCGDR